MTIAKAAPAVSSSIAPMTRDLLDHPLLASRYLFPRRVPLGDPYFVAAADGSSLLACHRASPHPGAPTVLHFHGNGEVVADYVPHMANLLTSLGMNVVFAEYRGYGSSTGSPTVGALLDDAEAIWQALGEPPERVVVFGRSVGSIPAIELAARHPSLCGLVLESSIADPLERLRMRVSAEELGVSPNELASAVLARMDHRAKLARYQGPMLVLHAVHDTLVPCSHAGRNVSWGGAPTKDKELILFPRGNHNTIFLENYDQYVAHLCRFIGRAAIDTQGR
jgi:alpha-beta hydrolase superfamily lysophospholipase